MAKNLQKLELTWIGKGDEPRLEPRILIENPEFSKQGKAEEVNDNILIHGDNLLALKALEQDFAGKVKCIYIDPPYNTGSRIDSDGKEIGYEDGIEHSTWLSMMKDRIKILHRLLSEDGSIFISIDNNEIAYLVVLMDEIFQRRNRKNIIIIKRASVTGAKVVNPGLVNISEYILLYAKNTQKWQPNRLYKHKARDERYGTFIENFDDPFINWRFSTVLQAFSKHVGVKSNFLKKHFGDEYENELESFVYENANKVIQFATLDEKSISKEALVLKKKSEDNIGKTFCLERDTKKPYYIHNGKLILFVKDRLQEIDGQLSFSEPLTDIWDDVLPNDLHTEGGVTFRKGKKPEKLIQRVISLCTQENDIVLDSFLGSGTTAAVAHKMGRRWIGIELGDHAITHCVPRLRAVCNGSDQGGISRAVGWKGGGGFRYYTLAPTLITKDNFDQDIINPEYNATMLAAAVAKHEGFRYNPDATFFWKQAQALSGNYCYVTTQFVSHTLLQSIHENMLEHEALLICCTQYEEGITKAYPNIRLKKIPHILLGKCDYKADSDYSFHIVNVPVEQEPDMEIFATIPVDEDTLKTTEKNTSKKTNPYSPPSLFE